MKNWEDEEKEESSSNSQELGEIVIYWSDGGATEVDANKLFVYSSHDPKSIMAAKNFVEKAKEDEEFFVLNMTNVNAISPTDVEVQGKQLLNESSSE